MKSEKVYEHVRVEWLEYKGKWSKPEHLNATNVTLTDTGTSQITILFPDGDKMRKAKTVKGLRIQGVEAREFFRDPAKYTAPKQ